MLNLNLEGLSGTQKVVEFPRAVRKRTAEVINHEKLFKDKNFTPEDWARHKTWHRFSPQFIVSFRILGGFAGPVVFHTTFAACVCIYHGVLQAKGAPEFWNHNTNIWQAFSLSSFCLALLLVHRLTATYNRWWEARIVWGSVLIMTRNLMRMCASPWGFPAEEQALLEMMARCIIAMPYCLRALVRFEPVEDILESLLSKEEVKFLVKGQQPCLRVAQMASSIVGQAMAGYEFHQTRLHLDSQIVLFGSYVGACERIYKTPVPHAFNRHLARFLNVWLFFLPFALWPVTGWATIFIELLLSYLLIATENIGVQIEEPFSIMPLLEFCKGMEKGVVEIMECYAEADAVAFKVRSEKRCHGYKRSELPSITVEGPSGVGAQIERSFSRAVQKSIEILPHLKTGRSQDGSNRSMHSNAQNPSQKGSQMAV